MKYSKEEYLQAWERVPFFETSDEESCYSFKFVKTRSLHSCGTGQYCKSPEGALTIFPKGTNMMKETAVIRELGWRSSYICTYCLDDWMTIHKRFWET